MAWMYILKCSDGTYYVGSTKDLEYRVSEHQSGKGAKYTSRRLPIKLVYSEEYERIVDAYTREKQVQNWSRIKRQALINGNPESLPSLRRKISQIRENELEIGGLDTLRYSTTEVNIHMAFFDLSLKELQAYCPERDEPADFDAFWKSTLDAVRTFPLDAKFEKVDYGLVAQETYDVTYNGFAQPVKGWLILPVQRNGKLPCVVEYIGYGGGRAFPIDWLLWASAGYAHFVMDTRGQGSSWSAGDTPDLYADGGNAHFPGNMTNGILDPRHYYYRRVFTDAVRAIEAARSHPSVDATQIALTGGSQGGGITIAAAALVPDVTAALPEVPFLCHYRRATELVDTYPYKEIAEYCHIHRDKVDTVFNTLSYFDGVNFAARAKAKTLFSVGLMDQVCPPSTVYAAYNHWSGEKDIKVYTYNGHEGGGSYHNVEKLKFLKSIWK